MINVILVGLFVALVVYAALSPLESLMWWSRQGSDEVRQTATELLGPSDAGATPSEPRVYLVYLSGVGSVDGTANSRRERAVLSAVAEAVPQVVVAADVFPYSVANRGLLTGSRVTTRMWEALRTLRRKKPMLGLHMLINTRNVFQMLVSADARYGPTFNVGIAQEIWRSLGRHGYRRESGSRVVIVGYSGGGQVAIGASWFLGMAGMDVSVISIGGMLSDDPGLDRIGHLWHFYGSKDSLESVGGVLFPGRWPTAPFSSWNRAVREGRISRQEIGPMRHNGKQDYFDDKAVASDGQTYAELTTAAMVGALHQVVAKMDAAA